MVQDGSSILNNFGKCQVNNIHTNLSLFNNISLLPPEFFGRFIVKFLFLSIKHGYSQMNIQKTWKTPSRFSKGEKRDKNE
jgi:hypothetical protein